MAKRLKLLTGAVLFVAIFGGAIAVLTGMPF